MELTRDLFIPLFDTNKGASASNYKWVPIDLSTQFEFAYNPNTETYSYICYKNDYTRVKGYSPELPQEIVLDNTNPMYKFMSEFLDSFPVGADAEIPFLLVKPDLTTGKPTVGMMWEKAVVSGDTLSTTDGKLSFNIALNGDPVKGTVSGIGTENVKFTASSTQAAKEDESAKAVKA